MENPSVTSLSIVAAWEWMSSWRPQRRRRPPAESRHWVHPSELPSFEDLATTANQHPHSKVPRLIVAVMAVLLVVGGVVLILNRGTATPGNDLPAQLAKSLNDLPASTRSAAAHTVELTISTPGHVTNVAALVLPNDLAVTTLAIPVTAEITGTTATKSNFPVTLEGRDDVMGFSIVHLSVNAAPQKIDAMPASAAVVAIAPIVKGPKNTPEYDWTMTTLGDPSNDAHGVVRYLAVKSTASLNNFVDAIAVDPAGHVVAVLSSTRFWYPAEFVAQVANVVATGHGCHADLGVVGTNEQGGGVLITKIVRYSPAAHAGLKVGDVLTGWNGTDLNTWNQLVSTLYLTPAYTKANITYAHGTTVHSTTVTLGCPSKLVP